MRALIALLLLASTAHAQTRFSADDLARLVDLTEPALSPDGRYL